MLLLLLVLAADPAKPKPVTAADCGALAEHGFELYLANLKNDEGVRYEMKDLSREQRAAYLKEVAQQLRQDRPRYVAEARAQCLERVQSNRGTRKQFDCAMAARTFPEVEKCLGMKLGGQAL